MTKPTLDEIVDANIARAPDPTPEEVAAWAKAHPVGKKKRTKAERQAAMTPAAGLAARLIQHLTDATAPVAPSPRPLPAPQQVWSTKVKDGRKYIRIVSIEHDDTATNGGNDSILSVVIDERGVRIRPAVLKGQLLKTKLASRELPTAFRYEESLTNETTTLDLSTDSGDEPQESTMSKSTKKSSSKKPSTSQGEPIRSFNRGLQILYLKQGTFSGYTTRAGKKYAMLVRKAKDGELTVLVADEAERLGRVGHGRKTTAAPKAKATKPVKVTKAPAKKTAKAKK